jgi:hypothetical protein
VQSSFLEIVNKNQKSLRKNKDDDELYESNSGSRNELNVAKHRTDLSPPVPRTGGVNKSYIRMRTTIDEAQDALIQVMTDG